MSFFRLAAVLFLTIRFFSPVVSAQFTTASLSGTVHDPSGAAVPGAKVTVRNIGTEVTSVVETNPAGEFLLPRLAVGNYTLTVEKEGFSAYVRAGVVLSVNQAANVDVSLQVGQVSERVQVEANAELVDTRTITNGQLIDRDRINELPLNGRNAQTLVFLSAGTVDLGRNGCVICGQGGVYPGEQTAGVNGTTRVQVNYQLDGVSHNDTYLNANLPFPNPDAIQEFSLQSGNFSAEYGNAAGGSVNIITRSGTNQWHGSLFEYVRNGSLNARNFFAPAQDTLKRNQFGGSFGGAILKNKLFFFGTYQGTRIRQAPAGAISFVPTAAERQGDFSATSARLVDPLTSTPFPGNRIPSSRLSPVAQFILKQVPLPNGAARQLTYTGTNNPQGENQFMPKIDYLTGKHQVSGRYFFTDFSAPAVIPTANVIAANSSGKAIRIQTVSLNHTYTASAHLLFNTTFGLNRQTGGSQSSAPFSFPDAGVKIATPTPPELSMSITGGFGLGTNHLGQFNRGDYTIREVATWVKGKHELRVGGELLRVTNDLVNTFQMAGSFSFTGELSGDGMADFLIGRAATFSQGGGEFKEFRGNKWSLFAQDAWRVTPRLTLNLGLRWDPWTPYWDRQGRVICWQPGAKSKRYPNAPTNLIFGGETADSGCPLAGSNAGYRNFAPRFGYAYRLTNDGKTSLRGGMGIYYTPIETTDYNVFADIAPFAPTFRYNNVDFSDPYGSVSAINPFPAQYGPKVPGADAQFILPVAVRAVFAPDFKIPQVISWNVTLERELSRDWLLRASYVGNKGTHLSEFVFRELNPAIYIPGQSTVANTQARRRYQDFVNVGLIESGNFSIYNGLQLTVEKRFSHGYTMLVNYTYSRSFDDLGWANPYYRAFDYGRASADIPHNFKFSNLWNIPTPHLNGPLRFLATGWGLNAIAVWQSGFPFSVSSGRDNSLTGIGRDRADYLGGQAMLDYGRSHGDMVNMWFATSQFASNALGTFGNSGRNILRGPRFFNTDLGVVKNTKVTERLNVQFRGEFFNAFNNVNFTQPNANRSSAQFGRITSALDPRILQLALRLQF